MPKVVSFSVTTADRSIPSEIECKEIAEDIKIRSGGRTIHEIIGFPETYTFLVEIGEKIALPIAVSLISSYLYDMLRAKPDVKLRITGIDIHIDKGEIEQILIKQLEKT